MPTGGDWVAQESNWIDNLIKMAKGEGGGGGAPAAPKPRLVDPKTGEEPLGMAAKLRAGCKGALKNEKGEITEAIAQLGLVQDAQMKDLARFLDGLKASREGNATLLDNTMVLLTSNLGNASSHDCRNMPVILAGGGFQHGQHLAFDQKKNYPLPNLYLSMLHRMGINDERFASSTGTMDGLLLRS
jgi:hypothetical protein